MLNGRDFLRPEKMTKKVVKKVLTNKVVNAIVILTRKVVNLLVGRWGTENSGTFDAARGPFGPTHAGRKEEKGRRQNAGGPVIQNISGYFRGNEHCHYSII